MNQSRFDVLMRALSGVPSRRHVLRGLLGLGYGLGAVRAPSVIEAKRKRRKHKKRKPKAKPNDFGCLEVGDPCKSAEQCCSGICEGKKGKQKCRAHDVGTCTPGQPDWCAVASVADEDLLPAACNDLQGLCIRTTADSNACINFHICADCKRDADCAAFGAPAGAVCAQFSGNKACAGFCAETGGMACFYFEAIDETRAAEGR